MYTIILKSSAQKEMNALEDSLFDRIDLKIRSLGDEPRPQGCKKLRGSKDGWRIRIGDWRLLYTIDDRHKVIEVAKIAHRREVYEP